MTTITLTTMINAPVKICFDLSRSIDLHQLSTGASNEKAIAGRLKGLIEEGEYVTWQATHFTIRQELTTKIIRVSAPHYFFDRMTAGPFKSMEHSHSFNTENGKTIMSDVFVYDVPYGIIGKLFDKMVLKKYMIRLLSDRNAMIKEIAESGGLKKFIRL